MTAITLQDLSNAKLDVDHIADLATSSALTAVDRKGNVKRTVAGALAEFPNAAAHHDAAALQAQAAQIAATSAAQSKTIVEARAAEALASSNSASTNAAISVGAAATATTAKTQAEAARDAAIIGSGVYATEAAGRAAVSDGQAFKVQGSGAVAAYEYRRTNSTTSVLIASYPSTDGVWQYRGEIASGTSVNSLTRAGTYYGAAASTINDKPAVFAGLAFQFFVYDSFGVNSRFQLQEIRQWGVPSNVMYRWFDSSAPTANPWVDGTRDGSIVSAKLAAKAVTAAKLADDFSYRGQVSSGSVDDLVLAGSYLINAGLAGAPIGSTTGYLRVSVHGFFVTQEYFNYQAPDIQWIRYVRTDGPTYGAWVSRNPDSRVFVGKKIAFLGDSITMNGDYPSQVVGRIGGTAIKLGFGGSRMAAHATYYNDFSFYKIAAAIATGNYSAQTASAAYLTGQAIADYNTPAALLASTNWATVDYLVVAYGTNDWGNSPIGADSDNSSAGASFKGAMNYGIQTLLTAYPNIKILFATPMFRSRQTAGDGLNSDDNLYLGTTLLSYVDAIIAIANRNHLPALDLYREGAVNKWNSSTYLLDGLHPNTAGYQLLAGKVSAALAAKF
nr:SGNH/GDSL hydrolase family protein [uncultured Rhodoferax sp.]